MLKLGFLRVILASILGAAATFIAATIITPIFFIISLFLGFGFIIQHFPVLAIILVVAVGCIESIGAGIIIDLIIIKSLPGSSKLISIVMYVMLLCLVIAYFTYVQPHKVSFFLPSSPLSYP